MNAMNNVLKQKGITESKQRYVLVQNILNAIPRGFLKPVILVESSFEEDKYGGVDFCLEIGNLLCGCRLLDSAKEGYNAMTFRAYRKEGTREILPSKYNEVERVIAKTELWDIFFFGYIDKQKRKITSWSVYTKEGLSEALLKVFDPKKVQWNFDFNGREDDLTGFFVLPRHLISPESELYNSNKTGFLDNQTKEYYK